MKQPVRRIIVAMMTALTLLPLLYASSTDLSAARDTLSANAVTGPGITDDTGDMGEATGNNQIATLITQLESPNEFLVREAVDALAEHGVAAIPQLINAFSAKDFQARNNAALALAQIGEPAIPAILKALQNDDPQIRWTAAGALVAEDLNDSLLYADDIHYSLLAALHDADPKVRNAAAIALWELTDEHSMPLFHDEERRNASIAALVKALGEQEKSVRVEAAQTLSKFAELQPTEGIDDIVSDLIALLADPDPYVRRVAAYTLGQMGALAQVAIPALTKALDDQEGMVRSAAAGAFATLGANSAELEKELREMLSDSSTEARANAAITLAQLGDYSKPIIRALRQALVYPDEDTREEAAMALGLTGEHAKPAVADLTRLMGDNFPEVRRAAAQTLGRVGTVAQQAIPDLIRGLNDRDPSVRAHSASALGRMGELAADAVPELTETLDDPSSSVQAAAARALGQVGDAAVKAIPKLTEQLNNGNPLVRQFSAETLAKISVRLSDEANRLSNADLGRAITKLEAAQQSLLEAESHDIENAGQYRDALTSIHLSLDALNNERYGLLYKVLDNTILVGIFTYVAGLLLLWWFLLWVRPLWLFHINHALEPYEFAAPRALSEKNRFKTRYFILVGFFYYHPRVLDAWVNSQLSVIRDAFDSKRSVKSRQANVPLPVKVDGEVVDQLRPEDLLPTFSRQPSCLLIHGEPGSGKAHLATQIARLAMSEDRSRAISDHPMIPVVIERDLVADEEKDSKSKKKATTQLIEVARGQLQNMTHSSKPLSADVVTALLMRPSILVVTPGFSEASKATRESIKPDSPDFPANALLVTSRNHETLGQVIKTDLETLRMDASEYPAFLHTYVQEQGKSELFDQAAYDEASRQMSDMVGHLQIPVLIAKLHADRTMAARMAAMANRKPLAESGLPDNIPALIHTYMSIINPAVSDNAGGHADLEAVYTSASTVAWACLEQSLRPQSISHRELLQALGDEDAEARIKYLIKPMSLLQIEGVTLNRYSFNLDFMAIYLAAMHLIDTFGFDESSWSRFFEWVDKQSSRSAAELHFLTALSLCCQVPAGQVPESVGDELRKRRERHQ